jgi:GTP-binding protein EngB required for normal cell division
VNNLSQKLASVQGRFLTIGLLGGTGVGKSTLMNALAGSEIASTSHRRPHTDQVLIYRHAEANPLPALGLGRVPWREILHRGNAMEQVLLCDLPDFDSLMGQHREQVIRFLEHLDILVWVTSPEKYADGRFYEFLQLVPKAKQNFYFVLNKVDLLFQGETPETGYEQMALVTRRFQEHIKENEFGEPLIYTVSALGPQDSDGLAPWNQFPAFRQLIRQQRDVKQITAIKTANLDSEVRQLLSAFQKEILNLETFGSILEDAERDLQKEREPWIQAGQEAVSLWLEKHISQDILFYQDDPSCLVGPGHALAALIHEFHGLLGKEKALPSDLTHFTLPEDIALSFRRRLEWLEERLSRSILRQNLPSLFLERLRGVLDTKKRFEDFSEGLINLLTARLSEPSLPSPWVFKTRQRLTYWLLGALFLLAIGSQTAWRGVLEDPGADSILGLFLSAVHTLFSPKGLAALGTYALLNLFFAFRHYHAYRKRLQRAVQRIIVSLGVGMGKVWEEELDTLLGDLNRLRGDTESQISTISSL